MNAERSLIHAGWSAAGARSVDDPAPAVDVELYDTTLRDGTQREGISLSCDDKLRIARRLGEMGVAYIEGGWPGSNPKDAQFFARARDLDLGRAVLAAFGSTRRAGVAVEDDPSLGALLAAHTPVCTIFGKSSTLHVKEVLRVSLDENLALIEDSVGFLRAHGRRVFFDAEHFFDGWSLDPAYARATLEAAARGGAEVLVLCDTNGGRLPWEIGEITAAVVAASGPRIGIHTHDDAGCAVANALAAVRAGARQVQGTVNGYGERCGNADLCAIGPSLELKLGLRCLPDGSLARMSDLSRFVAEVANLPPDEHRPYVGKSAFAHKGGVHVSAMRRQPTSYQHIAPEQVGNRSRVVVSELSGRANLVAMAEDHGLEMGDEAHVRVLTDVKAGEARGLSYEAAEASVALLLRRQTTGHRPPFRLIEYRVMTGQHEQPGASPRLSPHRLSPGREHDALFGGDSQGSPGGEPGAPAGGDSLRSWAEATMKIAVGAEVTHAVATGTGPVHALDLALRKALTPAFPSVARIRLIDYRVRILDGENSTSAITRVLIDSTDGARCWSTVGAGTDILAATWAALADSFEFGLDPTE